MKKVLLLALALIIMPVQGMQIPKKVTIGHVAAQEIVKESNKYYKTVMEQLPKLSQLQGFENKFERTKFLFAFKDKLANITPTELYQLKQLLDYFKADKKLVKQLLEDSGLLFTKLPIAELQKIRPQLVHTLIHQNFVHAVAWCNSNEIVTGSTDNMVRIWNVTTGLQEMALIGHQSSVGAVACSPVGTRIASGDYNGTIIIWNSAPPAQEEMRLIGHQSPVTAIAWSPDGAKLAAGYDDGTVIIWNAATGQDELRFFSGQPHVYSLDWSPDGTRIVTAPGIGEAAPSARIWNVATGNEVLRLNHSSRVNAAAWSPDNTKIVAGYKGGLKIWDADTGKKTTIWPVNKYTGNDVLTVAWSFDNTRIAAPIYPNSIGMWDAATGQVEMSTRSAGVLGSALSPDGTHIATRNLGDRTEIWRFFDFDQLWKLLDPEEQKKQKKMEESIERLMQEEKKQSYFDRIKAWFGWTQ